MSVTVPCPHCARKLTLRPEHLGQTLRCPACSGTFVAPAPPPSPDAPPWPPEPALVDPLPLEDHEGITSQPEPRAAPRLASAALRSRAFDEEDGYEEERPRRK